MKTLKIILCVVLAVALAATLTLSWVTTVQQNRSGGYSAVTTVTERSQAWILENFGHYETLPALVDGLSDFACEHFVYGKMTWFPVQHFSFDKFVFERGFNGVCFDFSCFAKCVVTEWSRLHGREDVQVFVYDIRTRKGQPHSYNFFVEDGATWFLCLTTDVSQVGKGKTPPGRDTVPNGDIDAYMKSYQERFMNVH